MPLLKPLKKLKKPRRQSASGILTHITTSDAAHKQNVDDHSTKSIIQTAARSEHRRIVRMRSSHDLEEHSNTSEALSDHLAVAQKAAARFKGFSRPPKLAQSGKQDDEQSVKQDVKQDMLDLKGEDAPTAVTVPMEEAAGTAALNMPPQGAEDWGTLPVVGAVTATKAAQVLVGSPETPSARNAAGVETQSEDGAEEANAKNRAVVETVDSEATDEYGSFVSDEEKEEEEEEDLFPAVDEYFVLQGRRVSMSARFHSHSHAQQQAQTDAGVKGSQRHAAPLVERFLKEQQMHHAASRRTSVAVTHARPEHMEKEQRRSSNIF